jgi:hypothetical protein
VSGRLLAAAYTCDHAAPTLPPGDSAQRPQQEAAVISDRYHYDYASTSHDHRGKYAEDRHDHYRCKNRAYLPPQEPRSFGRVGYKSSIRDLNVYQ